MTAAYVVDDETGDIAVTDQSDDDNDAVPHCNDAAKLLFASVQCNALITSRSIILVRLDLGNDNDNENNDAVKDLKSTSRIVVRHLSINKSNVCYFLLTMTCFIYFFILFLTLIKMNGIYYVAKY